jgi:hypothetical protein
MLSTRAATAEYLDSSKAACGLVIASVRQTRNVVESLIC